MTDLDYARDRNELLTWIARRIAPKETNAMLDYDRTLEPDPPDEEDEDEDDNDEDDGNDEGGDDDPEPDAAAVKVLIAG